MARIIGIRHRVKKTREGEARPTIMAIKENNNIIVYELETETNELDILLGRFPIEWRQVKEDEEINWFDAEKSPNGLRPHQCKWRKQKKGEDLSSFTAGFIRTSLDKKGIPFIEVLVGIPVKFDGLRKEDTVAMILGGSGDRFACALSRQGEEVEAQVFRVPPFHFSQNRPAGKDRNEDYFSLVTVYENQPGLFYKVRKRDRNLIAVKELLNLRQDAMKARIACQQRIYQSLIGWIFLNEEGKYPEGLVEDEYDKVKANDIILQALINEEVKREKELKKAVRELDVWQHIFSKVEGCGERIAAGIIAPIGDIRRFIAPNGAHRLKAYCGVHILKGGRYGDRPVDKQFPRRRKGEVASWSPSARQALYLLGDQFNRRPNSEWGQKLVAYKAYLKEKYPEPVQVETGEQAVSLLTGRLIKATTNRYTKGHLHKMALRHTLTKFVEWVYREWAKLEKENQQ